MAQISVRPTRSLLVKAIKEALKSIPADIEKYEQDKKQYEKDMKEWVASFDYSPANIKDASPRIDNCSGKVYGTTVTLKRFPANQPKVPKAPRFNGYAKHYAIDELERVLRLLELSDEERVNASVANRVIEYL